MDLLGAEAARPQQINVVVYKKLKQKLMFHAFCRSFQNNVSRVKPYKLLICSNLPPSLNGPPQKASPPLS